jgi:hypothetical protein
LLRIPPGYRALMLEEIREFLKRDSVSFAELGREIEGFRGDHEMVFADRNIVIWSGVSEAALDALTQIRAEGEYELAPCAVLVYLVDGAFLKYPLAKRAITYKTPHWLPCVWRRVQPQPKRRRRANG